MATNQLFSTPPENLADNIMVGSLPLSEILKMAKESESKNLDLLKKLDRVYQWLVVFHQRGAGHFDDLNAYLKRNGELIKHLKLMARLIKGQDFGQDNRELVQNYLNRWDLLVECLELLRVQLEIDDSEAALHYQIYVGPILNLLNRSKNSKTLWSITEIHQMLCSRYGNNFNNLAKLKAALSVMRSNGLLECVAPGTDSEQIYKLGYRYFWILAHYGEEGISRLKPEDSKVAVIQDNDVANNQVAQAELADS